MSHRAARRSHLRSHATRVHDRRAARRHRRPHHRRARARGNGRPRRGACRRRRAPHDAALTLPAPSSTRSPRSNAARWSAGSSTRDGICGGMDRHSRLGRGARRVDGRIGAASFDAPRHVPIGRPMRPRLKRRALHDRRAHGRAGDRRHHRGRHRERVATPAALLHQRGVARRAARFAARCHRHSPRRAPRTLASWRRRFGVLRLRARDPRDDRRRHRVRYRAWRRRHRRSRHRASGGRALLLRIQHGSASRRHRARVRRGRTRPRDRRRLDRARDLWRFAELHVVREITIRGPRRRDCANRSMLRFATGPRLPPTVQPGAFVRVLRRMRYRFYRAGTGEWYLGYSEWDGTGFRRRAASERSVRVILAVGAGAACSCATSTRQAPSCSSTADAERIARVSVVARGLARGALSGIERDAHRFTIHRRPREEPMSAAPDVSPPRAGFALPAAIIALVLLSALVAGALFVSTEELRSGRSDVVGPARSRRRRMGARPRRPRMGRGAESAARSSGAATSSSRNGWRLTTASSSPRHASSARPSG